MSSLRWLPALPAMVLGCSALAAGQVALRVDESAYARVEHVAPSIAKRIDYANFRYIEVDDATAATLLGVDGVSAVEGAGRIRFGRYDFDPLQDGAPATSSSYARNASGEGFRLVQLAGPIKQEWRDSLEAQGLRVLQYYPYDTFLIWGRDAAVNALAQQAFVRWQGPFLNAYKRHTDLDARSGTIRNVDVHFYNDGDIDGLLNALRSLGARVHTHGPAQPDKAFFDAWIEVDAGALDAIATLPQVLWFGYASPVRGLEDEMSAQIVAGNYNGSNVPQVGYAPWLASFGQNGSPLVWAITDTGADLTHPDLDPRISAGFSYPDCAPSVGGDDSADGGHGTHVSGIVAGMAIGDGVGPNAEMDAQGFLYGQGLATGVNLYPIASGCSAWPPPGGWQDLSKVAVLGNAIGTNNSWTTAEGTAHGYQASERTFDMMVRDGNFDTPALEPFIIVFSAGNSGPGASTLTSPKESKNPISTASSLNFRAGAITNISSFSSRGPAVDGRTLPTIAAPGDTIASTRRRAGAAQCGTAITGTGGNYSNCSGTSMASPHAAGTAVLLADWWGSTRAGAVPSPAMIKALLVNGALDIGTADIPNNIEGWGRIHLPTSAAQGLQAHYVDQTVLFNNVGDTHLATVGVADTSKPVEVTLAWSDAPGAVGANPALVNNLDLEVVDGANTYRGNVFTAGVSVTGGVADTRNNVENVLIAAPGGSIGITVRATTLPGDGVPGTGDATDQDFALVCRNCVQSPIYTLSATPSSQSVCAPANAVYNLTIGSVLGYNSTVNLSASGTPAGATSNVAPPSVTPPNTATLTIGNTAGIAVGTHSFSLNATSASGPQSRTLGLSVFNGAPAAPNLTSPANSAIGTATLPTFTWAATPNTVSYTIEVATDVGFTNIVASGTPTGTSFTPGANLNPNTQYFWRVRATNPCATGNNSTVFNFTTANQICFTGSLAIPDNTVAGVDSNLVVAQTGSVTDLNVNFEITHTWVGDLIVTLTHVSSGTAIAIMDRPGAPASANGCSGNDISTTLDDEAAGGTTVESQCGATPPVINGTFTPNNPLSGMDGRALNGTWRLNVADRAGADIGNLTKWCLIPTLQADLIFANGFQ